MRQWLRGWIGIVVATLILAFAMPASAQRIVAVGDLHGDYAAYSAILRAARLIDERERWIGGMRRIREALREGSFLKLKSS